MIAVDLDGTLCHWDGVWKGADVFGEPIPAMVSRVRKWIDEGYEVWVFTARLDPDYNSEEIRLAVRNAIRDWTKKHIGYALNATATKKVEFTEIWDDRAVPVKRNKGTIRDHDIGEDYEDARHRRL